jgi:hypothetical protein
MSRLSLIHRSPTDCCQHLAQHDGTRALSASQGEWRFDLDAWKKSKNISETTCLHEIAADRLKDYLADKAAAEMEP